MYIQLTTRCNMHCAHCCMSATAQGDDMTWETIKATFKFAEGMGEETNYLGGGEPTLNDHFWGAIGLGLATGELGLVTNGSMTAISIALSSMAYRGTLAVDLSQDQWHDPIDPSVVEAFTKHPDRFGYYNNPRDLRNIRTIRTENLIRAGRRRTGLDRCVCDGEFVKPNGDILMCGCANAVKIGTVFEGFTAPEDWMERYHDLDERCVKEYRRKYGTP